MIDVKNYPFSGWRAEKKASVVGGPRLYYWLVLCSSGANSLFFTSGGQRDSLEAAFFIP
uniref:Uncharacterized protein n=1 Tax=viral metagenome TaxID=1070528 RepID=A0A6M3JZ65_9ZZZZ